MKEYNIINTPKQIIPFKAEKILGQYDKLVYTTLNVNKKEEPRVYSDLLQDLLSKRPYVIFHTSYYEYLALAWANHFSAVVSPDIIWHIILNEISIEIKANKETYKSLFTTSNDKQEIIIYADHPTKINTEELIAQLKIKVPTNVDVFLPQFTTSTPDSKIAFNVAFCDTVSNYYSYSMMLCGIPNLRVEGTIKDWKLLQNNLKKLKSLLGDNLNKYLSKCCSSIDSLIRALTDGSESFFKFFYKVEECGSGSDEEITGWIVNFLNIEKNFYLINDVPNQIPTIEYKNLTTNKKYKMASGCMGSLIHNGYLIPFFDNIHREIPNVE